MENMGCLCQWKCFAFRITHATFYNPTEQLVNLPSTPRNQVYFLVQKNEGIQNKQNEKLKVQPPLKMQLQRYNGVVCLLVKRKSKLIKLIRYYI